MAWQQGPFRFMTFKEWVPDKIRFWIYILFLIAFQFSNGMYFTAMSQMQGSFSITMNDVKMMSHGVLIGLTMYFPVAFRMKARFPNRTNLIIAASGLMYFLVTPDTNIEKLYLPLILCNFGHLCIFIALTVFIQATAPFKNYFQILCILGFIRTGIASPIGDCIYQHGITGLMNKHLSSIGSNLNISLLDSMNNLKMIGSEAMSATLTELYGYTFIFGVAVILLIMIKKDFFVKS